MKAIAATRLENITKVYHLGGQSVHALAGVSATFEPGSFWAIMGASGSGKSTLLNILGCLDRPTAGRYLLGGNDTASQSDDALSDVRLRYIGFIFQSFNLIAQLTVEENIQLPLYYLGWLPDHARDRAAELAKRVGLGDRLKHRPSELSGGQQQRVAIARALANDPVMLLADEPTGNLDTATGREIMEMLGELNAQGKTIIMVTHEPDVANIARHHLVMRDGVVASAGGRRL
jgi:putative ABC transport system ATP-binding protein